MTAEEFLALGETPQRLELVDGVVVMSPSPLPLHQRIAFLIMQQIARTMPPGSQLFHETDVVLAPRLVYCPDIVVYAPGKLHGIPARLDLAPDLVVEVLSPANRRMDRVTKRDDYERHGVGEYWIVEPDDLSLEAFRRAGSTFENRALTSGVVECRAVSGVRVDLDALRREIEPA